MTGENVAPLGGAGIDDAENGCLWPSNPFCSFKGKFIFLHNLDFIYLASIKLR